VLPPVLALVVGFFHKTSPEHGDCVEK
jgi:hypothetical protein